MASYTYSKRDPTCITAGALMRKLSIRVYTHGI